MKNGLYFNFRDICDRNLWDTGYLVKKLQGYGILTPPLMGPHERSNSGYAIKPKKPVNDNQTPKCSGIHCG